MATVLTNAGRAIITNRLMGAGTEPKWIGWGTGAGTAGITDTTLFTEASEARTVGTGAQATTDVTNDTYRVTGTIIANAGKTITNAATFDALTTGNMFIKGDFTGVVLLTGESIAFTIDADFD